MIKEFKGLKIGKIVDVFYTDAPEYLKGHNEYSLYNNELYRTIGIEYNKNNILTFKLEKCVLVNEYGLYKPNLILVPCNEIKIRCLKYNNKFLALNLYYIGILKENDLVLFNVYTKRSEYANIPPMSGLSFKLDYLTNDEIKDKLDQIQNHKIFL